MAAQHSIFYFMKLKVILFAVILSAALLACAAMRGCFAPKHGSMRVQAVDAYTLEPISNARIIVPGCKNAVLTDDYGYAYFYDIPLDADPLFGKAYAAQWGETNIFAAAEGYLPYALLHAALRPNTLRHGPTLYLFPEGEAGVIITTVTEAPKQSDMLELFERLAVQYGES